MCTTNENMTIQKKKNGSFRSIFMHADLIDFLLMALGFFGVICDGISTPLMLVITSKLMNNLECIGYVLLGLWAMDRLFPRKIHRKFNGFFFDFTDLLPIGLGFLEGYCWTRTAERQASRVRARYLKAVLRQDVGYFDLHVTSTAEIIASVSSDSLVIQDVISEKVGIVVY
ncbi:unnamed protein product [Ilex paraguariensis]|uniref:ABC transmembrane type-1 domain-containing protein n=1 Tax=Ilex paraguariensis TaxID=185542 RepID=A0ABC8UBJ2_9AQUA